MKKTWISAVLAAVMTLVLITALGGCGRTDEQPVMGDAGRFEMVSKEGQWHCVCIVIEDRDTGVQYLITAYYDQSVSVTPLLDAEGKPYVAHREFDQGAEAYMPRKSASGKEDGAR